MIVVAFVVKPVPLTFISPPLTLIGVAVFIPVIVIEVESTVGVAVLFTSTTSSKLNGSGVVSSGAVKILNVPVLSPTVNATVVTPPPVALASPLNVTLSSLFTLPVLVV